MKKIYLIHYLLLCCMILAIAASCNDDKDSYDPDNVNDPEKLTDPLPTSDQLAVTHNNTLYYLSFWSKEDHAISDNMINRYKEVVPYVPGTKMEIGDAFFFTQQDIARIQSEADLLADFKDMFHKQSIVMMMEGGTNEDFNTVCTLLDCYNPYVKGDDSHSDELPLWVFSGPLPSARGFYSKLSALGTADGTENTKGTESGEPVQEPINEYAQGIHCDMTSQSLQMALSPKAPSNGSSDLKDLISAYIFIGQKSYKAASVNGRSGIDNFQVEAKIWPAYSKDRKEHFYLVNLGFIAYVEPSFYGEWHDERDWKKGYGLCLTNVNLEFAPVRPNGSIVHAHSPQTTEKQSSYTSNVSFELGGSVSVTGPEISGGVSISNSHTETINDIEVVNRTNPAQGSPQLRWQFNLREPSSHFNMFCYASSAVDAGAKAGISTCSLSTDFIISVPDGAANEWRVSMYPTLKAFLFSDVMGIHARVDFVYDNKARMGIEKVFNLPTVDLKDE